MDQEKDVNYDRCIGFPHVIEKGDTLYKLSKQYNVKVSALILANPYVNIYNLQVGDTICIPRIQPIVVPIGPGVPERPEMPMPQPPERPTPQPPERPMPPAPPRPMAPMPPLPQTPIQPRSVEMEVQEEPSMKMEDMKMMMSVKELLDEWDISLDMLETVMDIIKKMRSLL